MILKKYIVIVLKKEKLYLKNLKKDQIMIKRKITIFLLVAVFILAPVVLMVYGRVLYGGTSKEIEQMTTYDRHYVMITGEEDSGLWDVVYESARTEGEKDCTVLSKRQQEHEMCHAA